MRFKYRFVVLVIFNCIFSDFKDEHNYITWYINKDIGPHIHYLGIRNKGSFTKAALQYVSVFSKLYICTSPLFPF